MFEQKRGRRDASDPQAWVVWLVWLVLLIAPGTASAVTYDVSLALVPPSGATVQLAFDFIDGGPPSNTVTVSALVTDATLGSFSTTGAVSGSLPGTVTMTDTEFFNEYLQSVTFGTKLSFLLGATSNGPAAASSPDAFSLFMLDPSTGLPVFPTTDPTGSEALMRLDIDGSLRGALNVFDLFVPPCPPVQVCEPVPARPTVTVRLVSPVPEPTPLVLLGGALAAILAWRRVRAGGQRSGGVMRGRNAEGGQ